VAPGLYTLWIQLSGMLWIFCFCLFAFYYLPFLCKSRIDGRPG
jgi:uncharacterized protein involved in response to NO